MEILKIILTKFNQNKSKQKLSTNVATLKSKVIITHQQDGSLLVEIPSGVHDIADVCRFSRKAIVRLERKGPKDENNKCTIELSDGKKGVYINKNHQVSIAFEKMGDIDEFTKFLGIEDYEIYKPLDESRPAVINFKKNVITPNPDFKKTIKVAVKIKYNEDGELEFCSHDEVIQKAIKEQVFDNLKYQEEDTYTPAHLMSTSGHLPVRNEISFNDEDIALVKKSPRDSSQYGVYSYKSDVYVEIPNGLPKNLSSVFGEDMIVSGQQDKNRKKIKFSKEKFPKLYGDDCVVELNLDVPYNYQEAPSAKPHSPKSHSGSYCHLGSK